MEQLIYIEQNDKTEASKMAKGFAIEETRMRAYVNALGAELATKYLAQENINISNISNLHSIHKLREEFDIADIMLPNIHIDVRVIYDENLIFIPKSHFDYNLTPDIYIVFKMSDEATHVKFLGFFEPKLINKNNSNDGYYFIEKEKLSNPTDLKNYIENYNGNTTESMSEDELENAQRLAIALIDNNISDADKKSLITMLTKSATLRESLAEFDNFEWISYHTARNQDFDTLELTDDEDENDTSTITLVDEFEMFETPDEFEKFNNESTEIFTQEESEITDTDIVAEALHSIDVIQNGMELGGFEPLESETIDFTENVDFLDSFTAENNAEIFGEEINQEVNEEIQQDEPETATDDSIEETTEEVVEDSVEDLIETEVENISDINELTTNEDETLVMDESIQEEFDVNLEETTIDNFDETLSGENISDTFNDIETETELDPLLLEASENELLEGISLDEGIQTEEDLEIFDEILLDTAPEEYTETKETEETITNEAEEVEASEISTEEQTSEPMDFNNTEAPTINPETAEIIDSLLSDDILATLPDEDSDVDTDEDVSQEDITTAFTTTEQTGDSTETFSFGDLGTSDEYSLTTEDPSNNDEPLSFDNLSEKYATDDELAEPYNETEHIKNIESLTVENDIEDNGEQFDDTDFLNSLAEETENYTQNSESEREIPTVFENSTTITNENIQPGEISIDINQVMPEDITEEDMEKLEVLYNEENEPENFNFRTSSPERGKKAILAASIIIATFAGLFIFGSMNKTEDKITENNTPNPLEKNIPTTLDKNIPNAPEQQAPNDAQSNVPKALTPINPEEFGPTIPTPAPSPKEKAELDKLVKETKAELIKQKRTPIETPYLEVQRLSWSVPDYLSYNDQFKRYLQTAGKSLKLSLSSDLLLATEYAYSNQITAEIVLAKEGVLKDVKIGQSSGSSQIDAIVLRTVKETLNVVKAPAGLIVGPTANLTLKISL